uniref:Uncharacterized protein n=1 Tax=Knipowitschia caucasica TaxID=637954 RepID=A0AAV2LLM1_KNICA
MFGAVDCTSLSNCADMAYGIKAAKWRVSRPFTPWGPPLTCESQHASAGYHLPSPPVTARRQAAITPADNSYSRQASIKQGPGRSELTRRRAAPKVDI